MTPPRRTRRAALATASLLAMLGTAVLTTQPAHAENTAGVVLSDQVYRSIADGRFVRIRMDDRVTYPVTGGRGRVTGSVLADSNGDFPASPTTLSSYYTVWRVAAAGWRGRMWVSSTDLGAFSVGGLTAYRSGQSTATNSTASVTADLTAFMPIGAAVEHSATATFTPTTGVRITLTAWDRHTLY